MLPDFSPWLHGASPKLINHPTASPVADRQSIVSMKSIFVHRGALKMDRMDFMDSMDCAACAHLPSGASP
jgi:hypothetical protein